MGVFRNSLILVLPVLLWLPATGQAAPDTATELRLRSIEARLPDADKLAALERKVDRFSNGEGGSEAPAGGGGGSMFSLLQDVQGLQEEVRQLRGDVEELKHQAKQNEQGQRDLYQNLDARMKALEGGGGASAGTGSTDAAPTASAAAAPVDEAAAEKSYQAGFDLLKQGKYAESINALTGFVEQYPGSQYSDNAYYWLGEAHYVNREYAPALEAFRTVLKDYPDSGKAASSMYKIGVIQDEQGNTGAARQTLAAVADKYPNENAADLARKRLKAIGGNGAGN